MSLKWSVTVDKSVNTIILLLVKYAYYASCNAYVTHVSIHEPYPIIDIIR